MKRKRQEVRAWAAWRADRGYYVIRFLRPGWTKARQEKTDPLLQTRSVRNRRIADRQAAQLAERLANTVEIEYLCWARFCRRYRDEKLAGQPKKSHNQWHTARRAVERLLQPETLDDLTAASLSEFRGKLTAEGLARSSVASYLRELRTALNWAVGKVEGYEAPKVPIPKIKADKRAKGRPLTREEFDRILDAVEAVVGKDRAPAWRQLLRGLWLTGLRLGQGLALTWDDPNRPHLADLDTRAPLLVIPADHAKDGTAREIAMTPDAVAWFRKRPPTRRRGLVFRPLTRYGQAARQEATGKTIAKIGRRARVWIRDREKLDRKTGQRVTVAQFATAHDLRRSFGARWAPYVKPLVLMHMMQHGQIKTTNQFYIGQNTARNAAAIRAGFREMQKAIRPARRPKRRDQNVTNSQKGRRRRRRPRPKA